jgi:hypothetical protein
MRLAPGMPGRSYQTKPGLPSGCQVNIKCFYAKSTCLGSIIETSSVWPWCRTLVQKVIPGYLQRTVDNYSWAYLWLISHDLSHGVPLMCAWKNSLRNTKTNWMKSFRDLIIAGRMLNVTQTVNFHCRYRLRTVRNVYSRVCNRSIPDWWEEIWHWYICNPDICGSS